MGKYIDAGLLKSKLKNVATEFKTGNYYLDNSEQAVGYENALMDFEQIIDSLQQGQPEQQEPPGIERAEYYYHKGVYEGISQGRAEALKILEKFMKVNADPVIVIKQQEQPDFPTTDEQMKEFLATTPKIKVPEKYNNSDWMFKKQEQPEEDLSADIEMEWDSFNKHLAEYGEESEEVVWLNWYNFNELARYFYELGLNARKEE